jgi:hypothetical protein
VAGAGRADQQPAAGPVGALGRGGAVAQLGDPPDRARRDPGQGTGGVAGPGGRGGIRLGLARTGAEGDHPPVVGVARF